MSLQVERSSTLPVPIYTPNATSSSSTTDKVKYLFSPDDWLFIGSALALSSAIGVMFLALVGRVSFVKPFSGCVISSVILRALWWTMKDQTFDMTPLVNIANSFIPRPIFDTTPVRGEGTDGAYPVLKLGNIRERYHTELCNLPIDERWKKMMVLLLKNYLTSSTVHTKTIFDQISDIGTASKFTVEEQFFSFIEKPEVLQAYSEAISNPNYYFSTIEIDFIVELFKDNSSAIKVVPLINRGTDCFMNATFQVIMHDELLRDILIEKYQTETTPEAIALRRAIQLYSEGRMVSTFLLRQFMPDQNQLGQQDAYEFLQMIINYIDPNQCPDLFPTQTTTYSWEQKDQSGQVIRQKKTNVSAREFNSIIQIPSQAEMISGQELIDNHFGLKKHEGEVWTDEEAEYSPGQQQIQLTETPKKLTFVLKRFDQNNKISTEVDMPDVLVVNQKKYSLKKIIIHHGFTKNSGHYTALLQIEGRWIKADDTRISEISDPSKDRQNGYIYFYEE